MKHIESLTKELPAIVRASLLWTNDQAGFMAWTSLCDLDELVEKQGKYVEIDGFHLAVFLSDGKISVIDDRCPHAGGSLSGGAVEEGCAICPWHAWAFRLDNGQLRDAPGVAVSTYESRVYDYQGRRVVQAELPSV